MEGFVIHSNNVYPGFDLWRVVGWRVQWRRGGGGGGCLLGWLLSLRDFGGRVILRGRRSIEIRLFFDSR